MQPLPTTALATPIDAELVRVAPSSDNPALVYLASLGTEHGRRTMTQALDSIAHLVAPGSDLRSFPWANLRFQHTTAIRSKLAESYAPATVNKMLSALRGTLKAAWQLGQMGAEDYQRATDLRSVRGETLPAGRAVTQGELMALVAACRKDATAAGKRDGALLALLWACGLRRAEVVALDRADYDADTGELRIRKGKGRKERLVWVTNGAADALADWLAERGDEAGALFHPVNKGGRILPSRMTSQAVYNMLDKRATEASVKALSPHDLRRTFVGSLLDAGADIATVARLAGHANVQTTARYDRRPEEVKRKAAAMLHFPWQRTP